MKNTSKRNGMFCALAAAALLLGGCAQGQGKMAYIGVDAVKKQILAEVGLDESQVKINNVSMATKNGMDYYRVEFSDKNGNTYRYDIEALTGKVIEGAAADIAGDATDGAAAETTAAAAETLAAPVSKTAAAAVKTAGGSSAVLTAEEAKTKALAHAGLSASQVTFTKAKLDRDDGKQVYDVEFYGSDMTEYDYEVDAATGAILSVDKDREAAQRPAQAAAANGAAQTAAANEATRAAAVNGAAQTAAANEATQAATVNGAAQTAAANGAAQTAAANGAAQTAAANEATRAAGNTTQAANSTAQAATGSAKLTVEEAKAKALAHAGLSASQVTFVKAESDRDDGRLIYEIDFYGNDGTEYEYEIDANTGDVIKYDTEAPKISVFESQPAADTYANTYMSADEAKKLALQQVPGATAGDIAEFETDRDNGRIEYEGKICYGGMEYEFEIDAYSGAFRKWECEYDDDHHD